MSYRYQYTIPYEHGPGAGEWRIIFTEDGHFYFNPVLRRSYWQIADLCKAYPEINIDEFVQSISFEDVAVLSALVKGFNLNDYLVSEKTKEKTEDKTKEKTKEKTKDKTEEKTEEKTKEKTEVNDKVQGEDELFESELEEENKLFETDKDRDEFLANLLKEEEEGKTSEDRSLESPSHEEKGAQNQQPQVLVLGYSSDEETSDEEIGNNSVNTSNDVKTNDVKTSDMDNNSPESHEILNDDSDNLSLDLSVDEAAPSTEEFLSLLDRFKDQISVYDPWDIVEEELASELIQNPEYFSLAAEQREAAFNQWCEMHAKDQDPVETEAKDISINPTLQYLRLLQDYKKDIKKKYFPEFYAEHVEELNEIDLPRRTKENVYVALKRMLVDFEQYERKEKKIRKDGPNLKVMHLKLFLQENKNKKESGTISEPVPQDNYFEAWVKMVNDRVPEDVVHNVRNFIVGDEKRYHIYREWR